VAIDGPGGAGKSTVAKLVAATTGLRYLDTGAMYRAITFGVLARGVDPADWPAVADVLPAIAIDVGEVSVIVDGVDATEAIRGPEVTQHVSAVAANPAVRTALVQLQKQWIESGDGGVLEGRDIGTVVAPEAAVKVYVTASVRERARRRSVETGDDIDVVEADLIRRDALDSERADSPLRPADDAVHIDTTEHTIPEVADMIVALVVARGLVESGSPT
jgi:cytidylate kinase